MTKPKTPASPKPATPKPTNAEAPQLPAAILIDDADNPCAAPPEVYDPADYRWVPVRRRPRYDGWTEEKQRRFIEALADTGVVGLAAKAVGMTRESANRLRRSPHGAAFSRAWDAARAAAGSVIEDVAFERALEGVAQNIYDEDGAVVCTKRVYNDRLLMFLLRNLKPERYGRRLMGAGALERLRADGAVANGLPPGETIDADPHSALTANLAASLAAMEPVLPAPPTALLDLEALEEELILAEAADGVLPQFLNEQRPARPELDPVKAARLAQVQRGEAIERAIVGTRDLTAEEYKDWCAYHEALDPLPRKGKPKRFR